MDFLDRALICSDCGQQFVFTAGEQLFFFDKQFKNDPKRCKPCKGKRTVVMARTVIGRDGAVMMASGLTRTETRTECSECGVDTTVPFKPTQGRPVLCRQCFQRRMPLVADSAMVDNAQRSLMQRAAFGAAGMGAENRDRAVAQMQSATTELVAAASANDNGSNSSPERSSQSS